LISLPGPNEEVDLGIEAALGVLAEEANPAMVAGAVADVLCERLSEKMRSPGKHSTPHHRCDDPDSPHAGWES
jgi:hypothetical protein